MNVKKILLALVLAIGLALIFIYMAGGFSSKIDHLVIDSKPAVQPAAVVTVTQTTLPIIQDYSGQLMARQQANLAARISAQVAEVLVNVGDTVEQGDILLRLASDDLDAQLSQQQQQLAATQAQLNEARLEYQRTIQLLKKSLVPLAQKDQAEAALKTAQANFSGAKAAVSEAKTTFAYSLITAPFSGLVSQRPVNQGDYASPGTVLISLYQPRSVELAVAVPESQLKHLALAQSWPVSIDALSSERSAEVVEITPAASGSAHSFLIKLRFDDASGLFPGMFARLHLSQGEQRVIMIPVAAVYQRGQLTYVNRLTPNGVEPTIVKPAQVVDDMIVIRSGLSSVDRVSLAK